MVRLLICAGGTGGGIYPAMSVLQTNSKNSQLNPADSSDDSLHQDIPAPFEILWVGGIGGMEENLVTHAEIPFTAIPAAGVHGVGLTQLPGNLLKLFQGFLSACRILKEFKPDVAFFTGGYIAVPVALAAAISRIPSLLYVPDIEPGLALKFVSRFATCIALTTETSRQYFQSNTDTPSDDNLFVTGYPTRPDLKCWDQESAHEKLGLHNDLPVIVVFGGSKGARSINKALLPSLPHLLSKTQIVHISGKLDWQEVETHQNDLPENLAKNYHPFPYLHEMGAAFCSADLVVSRSGAAVLGEYPLMGLPAILVPYPYAWRYQYINAKYLADQGAARIIRDEDLSSQLLPTILQLINDPEKLKDMRTSMKSLYRSDAARHIAALISGLGNHHSISDIKKGLSWSS